MRSFMSDIGADLLQQIVSLTVPLLTPITYTTCALAAAQGCHSALFLGIKVAGSQSGRHSPSWALAAGSIPSPLIPAPHAKGGMGREDVVHHGQPVLPASCPGGWMGWQGMALLCLLLPSFPCNGKQWLHGSSFTFPTPFLPVLSRGVGKAHPFVLPGRSSRPVSHSSHKEAVKEVRKDMNLNAVL